MGSSVPKKGEFQDGQWWFIRQATFLTIGLTEAGFDQVGDLTSFTPLENGDECSRGEILWRLVGTEGSIELPSPGAGVVSDINPLLHDMEDEEFSQKWKALRDQGEDGWLLHIDLEAVLDFLEFLQDNV